MTPEIAVSYSVHIFLKLTGCWKRALCSLRTLLSLFQEKNNNTVECLGKLCCILLRRHQKEVVGDPWTFFPLFSLFPASARIQFYVYNMGCREGWSKYTANIIDSTTYQAFFVTSAAWIHLFWASSVQKSEEWKAPQKPLRYQPDFLVCCWKFKQTVL